jgi:hypothetical protein
MNVIHAQYAQGLESSPFYQTIIAFETERFKALAAHDVPL